MDVADVHGALAQLDAAGVATCLDGGWGVDALLGRQTRPHPDLDVVIARDDVARVLDALGDLGFSHDHASEPGLPARLVLNGRGRVIDCHVVVFDGEGNGWQELDDEAWGAYPVDGLGGTGLIGGRPVRCITADLQVRHHLGYPPSHKDLRDMRALADAFDVALPPGW